MASNKINKIEIHLEKINQEMGFVRDRLATIEADMKWIRWFVITSAGALIVGVVNLILFMKNGV